jgi:lysyl-tRNA synthetase class 1
MMNRDEIKLAAHWADIWADKVISEQGSKPEYTCASGITPSGTVHIGNFREIISTELVYRALCQKGCLTRFIYSWDDYDVFRKVPPNMPNQGLLQAHLRYPIDAVPDPHNLYESYARANEVYLEKMLPLLGINPIYISQSKQYRAHTYAQGMQTALQNRDQIIAILNKFRTKPLEEPWWPVSFFCESCHRDNTTTLNYDNQWTVTYQCDDCKYHASVDLRETSVAKLMWRIDWPMRWAFEQVDFEPAGKDHHTEGGSFDTGREIVSSIYKHHAPSSFMYEFVSIKGGSGKISSSGGEVIDLSDCLAVYQPEVVRYLFASTRPNVAFAISFDTDVLKIYEDYDKCERFYYNKPSPDDPKKLKKWAKEARIYELSQVSGCEAMPPYQVQIRHLCTYLQIHNGDIATTIKALGAVKSEQEERLSQRCICAWNWLIKCAPEDYRFSLRTSGNPLPLNAFEWSVLRPFIALVNQMNEFEEESFAIALYDIAKSMNIESPTLFPVIYKVLLGKSKGPRLVSFLFVIGQQRLQTILQSYLIIEGSN